MGGCTQIYCFLLTPPAVDTILQQCSCMSLRWEDMCHSAHQLKIKINTNILTNDVKTTHFLPLGAGVSVYYILYFFNHLELLNLKLHKVDLGGGVGGDSVSYAETDEVRKGPTWDKPRWTDAVSEVYIILPSEATTNTKPSRVCMNKVKQKVYFKHKAVRLAFIHLFIFTFLG